MVTTLVLQLPRTAPLRSLALPDCRSLEVATVVGAQLESLNLTGCSELHSLSLQCDSLAELSLSLVRVVFHPRYSPMRALHLSTMRSTCRFLPRVSRHMEVLQKCNRSKTAGFQHRRTGSRLAHPVTPFAAPWSSTPSIQTPLGHPLDRTETPRDPTQSITLLTPHYSTAHPPPLSTWRAAVWQAGRVSQVQVRHAAFAQSERLPAAAGRAAARADGELHSTHRAQPLGVR